VFIVFSLDDRDGDVWFVVENVVRELRLSAGHHLASDVDLPFGEVDLALDLGPLHPSRRDYGRRDELRRDVSLAEVSLAHIRTAAFGDVAWWG
jgi:hypothetical protein